MHISWGRWGDLLTLVECGGAVDVSGDEGGFRLLPHCVVPHSPYTALWREEKCNETNSGLEYCWNTVEYGLTGLRAFLSTLITSTSINYLSTSIKLHLYSTFHTRMQCNALHKKYKNCSNRTYAK